MPTSNSPCPSRVLVIDDTPAIHDDFRKILEPESGDRLRFDATAAAFLGDATPARTRRTFELDHAFQGQEGLAMVRQALAAGRPYALAFVDMRMPPGWDGLETIRHLWATDPALQVVICTAYSDYSWEQTQDFLGDSDNLVILKKPFDNIEVQQLACALTRKWVVSRTVQANLAELDERVRQRTDQLHASEERFALAFRASPVAMLIHRLADDRPLDFDEALVHLTGHPREAILSSTPAQLRLWAHPAVWTTFLEELRAGFPVRDRSLSLRQVDGAVRELQCYAQPITIDGQACAFLVLLDHTDRVRLEFQLRQAQKLEAIGQLAAGVAHDFNNLLTVILGYAVTAAETESLPGELRSDLGQITAAAERATALTRQLLLFSRRQVKQREPLDAGACLFDLRGMLDRLLGEQVTVAWNCQPGLPRILADRADLEQVVINLAVNARDAVAPGGRIEIRLSAVDVDESAARAHPGAKPGIHLSLVVTDNGCGMDEHVRRHLFEPFFTTKPVGKGTGLGLSTVYAIVAQLGGWIHVDSTIGQGTAFTLSFPTLPEPPSAPARETAAPETRATLTGTGRILLVEDDEQIRRLFDKLLRQFGYEVTTASDGPTALAAFGVAERPFDLLLSDMVMPHGITGADLAGRIRAQHPALRVILMSGYSADLLAAAEPLLEDARVLIKPFTHIRLLQALREELAKPPGP